MYAALLEKRENCIRCTKTLNERKLWNVVSGKHASLECRWFERGNKIQSSKLSVASWIFPNITDIFVKKNAFNLM